MCEHRRRTLAHRQAGRGPLRPDGRPIDLRVPMSAYVRPETPEERLNRILRESVTPPEAPTREEPVNHSEAASLVRRILSIPTEVRIERDHGMVHLSASGATVELRSGDTRVGGTMSTDGTPGAYVQTTRGETTTRVSAELGRPVRMVTTYRDLRFTGTIGPERWSMSLTWGPTAPNLAQIESIFRNGESGMRGSLGALGQLQSLGDVGSVTDAISPHVDPIVKAVKTAGAIQGIREGISFSITASGPGPSGDRSEGSSVMGLLTIRF